MRVSRILIPVSILALLIFLLSLISCFGKANDYKKKASILIESQNHEIETLKHELSEANEEIQGILSSNDTDDEDLLYIKELETYIFKDNKYIVQSKVQKANLYDTSTFVFGYEWLDIGETIRIVEIINDFAHIENEKDDSWIPIWYLLNRVDSFEDNPYFMVTRTEAELFLYPNAKKALYDSYTLEKGKLVKVIGQFDDFLRVEFINYAEPELSPTWVKRSDLTEKKQNNVIEGYVINANELYSYNQRSKVYKHQPGDIDNSTIVMIVEEVDDHYLIMANGGIMKYTPKSNFLPLESY